MIVRQDPANMPKAKPVRVFMLILKDDLSGSPFNNLWAIPNRAAWS